MKRHPVKEVLYGMLARLVSSIVPVKRGLWIFGSDLGNMYREGSKYLLEYTVKNHPEYSCRFVTRSKCVYADLRRRNIPCVMNLSLFGIWTTARAECVFTTQQMTDVLFAYKKRNRRFFYLVHGQPLKVAIEQLAKTNYYSKSVFVNTRKKSSFVRRVRAMISSFFLCGTKYSDSEFISATSEFLSKWQKFDFGERVPSKVLGMPRNDALFQPERMASEKWIPNVEGKLVISYMPTHRLYGRGEFSPAPFRNRPDVQEWMLKNDVVLVVKNHPTMLLYKKNDGVYESECIKDITSAGIDPMTVVFHSDALITDYSSVWMDYLLLRRPILFYIYDDFINDDVGVYYDVKEEHVGRFCYSEDELFDLIKQVKCNYESMCPAKEVVRKFHKYVDGNSCERYFKEITRVTDDK